MSDNKKYQGSKDNRRFSSSKEDKSGTTSRRARTNEQGAKVSREFSSSREDKNRVSNRKTREGQENVTENKKFTRDRAEVSPRSSNANEEIETKIMREDLIEGRNAVIEALKSDRTIEYILIAKGDMVGSISVVLGLGKRKGNCYKRSRQKKARSNVTNFITSRSYCSSNTLQIF